VKTFIIKVISIAKVSLMASVLQMVFNVLHHIVVVILDLIINV